MIRSAAIRREIQRWITIVAVVLAVILIVILGLKNRDLQTEVMDWRRRALFPYPGFVVPPFKAVTFDGDSVAIGHTKAGNRQVLFFFNTTCGFCVETLPMWKRVHSELIASVPEFEVFGVSLDSWPETRDYAQKHDLPFPIVHLPNSRLAKMYRAEVIPLTIVLDHEGTVLHSRLGSIITAPAVDSILTVAKLASNPNLTPD